MASPPLLDIWRGSRQQAEETRGREECSGQKEQHVWRPEGQRSSGPLGCWESRRYAPVVRLEGWGVCVGAGGPQGE